MEDTYETGLRRRFAQAETLADDESFVVKLRARRLRVRRRNALLRVLFVGALLLATMAAMALLLPWLLKGLHEVESQLAKLLQGAYSPTSLIGCMAILSASAIGVWAWAQTARRD